MAERLDGRWEHEHRAVAVVLPQTLLGQCPEELNRVFQPAPLDGRGDLLVITLVDAPSGDLQSQIRAAPSGDCQGQDQRMEVGLTLAVAHRQQIR